MKKVSEFMEESGLHKYWLSNNKKKCGLVGGDILYRKKAAYLTLEGLSKVKKSIRYLHAINGMKIVPPSKPSELEADNVMWDDCWHPHIEGKQCKWCKWYNNEQYYWKQEKNWTHQYWLVQAKAVVGYFCHLFREKMGFEYAFDYNYLDPSKEVEFSQAFSLIQTLGTVESVMSFLDWMMKKRSPKSPITAFGLTLPMAASYLKTKKRRKKFANNPKIRKQIKDVLLAYGITDIAKRHGTQVNKQRGMIRGIRGKVIETVVEPNVKSDDRFDFDNIGE
jgi:hypothetical protein